MNLSKHAEGAKDSIDVLLERIEELEAIVDDLEDENKGLRDTIDNLNSTLSEYQETKSQEEIKNDISDYQVC